MKCNLVRLINQLRKALGFSHAISKPRLVKTPNFAANLEAGVIKALGAQWKEPTDTVMAERKARAIEFQKAMSNEDTKTNP